MYRKGSTNTLDGEDEEWKKARGYGQPGRQYRVQSALRVMGAQPDVPMEEVDPDYKNRSIRVSTKSPCSCSISGVCLLLVFSTSVPIY